jgi:hypothetical protein
MELKCTSTCSQNVANVIYTELDVSSQLPPSDFFRTHVNVTVPPVLGASSLREGNLYFPSLYYPSI